MFGHSSWKFAAGVLLAVALVLFVATPAFAQTVPVAGGDTSGFSWKSVSAFFTNGQDMLMTVAGVICVFALVFGVISAASSGFHGVTIAAFCVVLACIFIMGAPYIIPWIRSLWGAVALAPGAPVAHVAYQSLRTALNVALHGPIA